MANNAFLVGSGNNGTITVTAPAAPSTTWNLCSLIISQSGGSVGPNSKVSVWDGAVGSGTLLFSVFLSAPGAFIAGTGGLGGSVGIKEDVPLPRSPQGLPGVQASPGNAMNIQVTGTALNNVIVNARLSDGLP